MDLLAQTIRVFWDAVQAKDEAGINAAYWPDEFTYVVLEGPRLTTSGYAAISKGWRDFCASGIDMTHCDWIEGPREEINGDMGWIAGVFKLEVNIAGRRVERTFRGSFVMLKDATGQWLIRHEHVSAAMEDPYGIGDWLQEA